MEYTTRRVDDVVIVDLEGRAAIGSPGVTMRQIVGDLLDSGHRRILFNFAGVGYIDSGGLGDLVVSFVKAKQRDGQLMLLNLEEKHQDVLEMTHLIEVIRHFADEAEAVAGFDRVGEAG